MILPFLSQLLVFGLLLLLFAAMLSPLESLGWWAGWFGPIREQPIASSADEADLLANSAEHYLVYLSGIGAISGDFLEHEEIVFLDNIEVRVPDTVVVRDVFPYAMNNNGLTGHRLFLSMWNGIIYLKLKNRKLLTNIINIRNMFQVVVSADRRYGPIYNYGTAGVIYDGLLRKGYPVGSGRPVTILGYSGGAQIALGAATYLHSMLPAPLRIISFGGVMSDDPGLEHIEHLYHFYGERDIIPKLGAMAYAGRWPLLPYSPWNQARKQGKITLIPAGPITHNDPGGYFLAVHKPHTGETPQDQIVDRVVELLNQRPEQLKLAHNA